MALTVGEERRKNQQKLFPSVSWACILLLLGCLSSLTARMRNLLSVCKPEGKLCQLDADRTLLVMSPLEHVKG